MRAEMLAFAGKKRHDTAILASPQRRHAEHRWEARGNESNGEQD